MAVLEGIVMKKKLKAKLLWHVHEIIVKPQLIFKILCFFIGIYADKCIAVSKAVSNHLLRSKLINTDKLKVIYNGVDSTNTEFHGLPYAIVYSALQHLEQTGQCALFEGDDLPSLGVKFIKK